MRKCPGSDPVSKAVPELFPCPKCDTAIEIWSDEVGGKCSSCNTYFKKILLTNMSDMLSSPLNQKNAKIKELIQDAHKSGATDVVIVSTKDIVVDNNLADRCREPRCENYGLSKSCPPNVAGPSAFRKQLEKFSQAIFLKIDVPSETLYSSERREIFQLLHEIAAGIEQYAVKMGFANSQAYAGGSCKKIFCHNHLECLSLSEKGKCRNPQYARPSMSGFGINVAKLIATAGWTMSGVTHDTDSTTTKMANVYGLVLIC
jgi:predicted metal-binding protein